MVESKYQAQLIKKIRLLFPDCVIIKLPENYIQGIPDLLILFGDQWAALEVKAYSGAPEQPNQNYYVELFDAMSFAAFIYPENEKEVLSELQQAFGSRR